MSDAAMLYKSSARRAEIAALPWTQRWALVDRGDGRDESGRFIARWSGRLCDRIGCDSRIEAPGRRFCAVHRAEHGQRLLGQLRSVAAVLPEEPPS